MISQASILLLLVGLPCAASPPTIGKISEGPFSCASARRLVSARRLSFENTEHAGGQPEAHATSPAATAVFPQINDDL